MLKILAILFGLIMLAIGIMGYIPDFSPNQRLFTLFSINFWNNLFHIATGVIALLCGLTSRAASKFFFIIAGLIYALLAVFGFLERDILFGLMEANTADNLLNLIVGIICLYFGFFLGSHRS
jgi:hypothetical protein